MTDRISPSQRSANMARIRSRNTEPEMIARRFLHALGYRYRVSTDLPGRPDIVFSGRRVAVFVHGCFWHQHGCDRTVSPSSNRDYWVPKLERNVQRDERVQRELEALGWTSVVIWECVLRGDPAAALKPLMSLLDERPTPGSRGQRSRRLA